MDGATAAVRQPYEIERHGRDSQVEVLYQFLCDVVQPGPGIQQRTNGLSADVGEYVRRRVADGRANWHSSCSWRVVPRYQFRRDARHQDSFPLQPGCTEQLSTHGVTLDRTHAHKQRSIGFAGRENASGSSRSL